MIKRVIIAGCRNYTNYEQAKEYIDFCISNIRQKYELIFVSGGCTGADAIGERYAKENGFKLEVYPAKWKKYGKAAGPKRNAEMVKIGDYFICFGDNKNSSWIRMNLICKEFYVYIFISMFQLIVRVVWDFHL